MQRRHFIILMLFSGLMLTMWFINQIQYSNLSRDKSRDYNEVRIEGAEIIIDESHYDAPSTSQADTCRLPADAYDRLKKEYMAQDALSRQISYLENMNGDVLVISDTLSRHETPAQPK